MMKPSGIEWIGDIPDSWKTNTAFQIFTQVKNKNEGLKEQNLLSLSYGKIKRKSIETVGGLLPENFDGYNIIEADDIVLRLTDLQNDQKSLRVGISPERGIVTSAYLTLRNRSTSLPEYLYYYLHAFDISKGFYGMGAGVRQGLNWDGLKWLKILTPPVHEQEKIVSFLDAECARIGAVVEQTRASIEEYKKLKQSVITEAVTKGIRPGRKMKDSGVEWIGVVPEEWVVTKLKYFSSIRSGITLGKTYSRDTKLVEYPYLRVANVQGSYTDLTDVATILITEEEAEKYRLHDGELLMTEGGDRDKLGRGTVWHAEIDLCLHQNHVFALTTNDDLSAEYVSFLSASFVGRDYFDVTANQSVHLASTNSTTIMNFTIPVPKIEEQNEIVSYLFEKTEELEKLIAKKQALISDLESYKKSLIFEYVTGKKEVV